MIIKAIVFLVIVATDSPSFTVVKSYPDVDSCEKFIQFLRDNPELDQSIVKRTSCLTVLDPTASQAARQKATILLNKALEI